MSAANGSKCDVQSLSMTNKNRYPEARRSPVLGPEGVELDLLGSEGRVVGQLGPVIAVKQKRLDFLLRLRLKGCQSVASQ